MLSHQSYLFLFCFSQCKLRPSTVKLHCSTSTSLQNDNGCLLQEDCISRFLFKRVLSGGYVWNQWLVVAWSTPFAYFESLGRGNLRLIPPIWHMVQKVMILCTFSPIMQSLEFLWLSQKEPKGNMALQFKFFLGLGLCLSIHLRWGCALCFVWMNSFAQWKWVSKWRCIWPSDIRVS
jgi:hypothetical protein